MIISLTIDGKTVNAVKGKNLLRVALANGVYIPNLCYIQERSPQAAACRLCWVGIGGRENPVTACTETVYEGMVVDTGDKTARRLALAAFRLIMASHPVECARCARNGTCELQKIARHLEVKLDSPQLKRILHNIKPDDSHPLFRYDPEKCVLCGRCVWVCREKVHQAVLGFAYRGFRRMVTTFEGEPLASYECKECKACVAVCPVGALKQK